MPSDTPTTEAGRRLAVETYGEDSLLSEKMGHRIAAIEAEAVRSFVLMIDKLVAYGHHRWPERVRETIEGVADELSIGHESYDLCRVDGADLAEQLRALLQAETPDASDSGEGDDFRTLMNVVTSLGHFDRTRDGSPCFCDTLDNVGADGKAINEMSHRPRCRSARLQLGVADVSREPRP
jgi:hypothetical protein